MQYSAGPSRLIGEMIFIATITLVQSVEYLEVVYVRSSYETAKKKNALNYLNGEVTATEYYTYPNYIKDASAVVRILYEENKCIVSVQKRTKVGADGFIIELMTYAALNYVPLSGVRVLTGMSNRYWEKELIAKVPDCFSKSIFHHGKLSKADIKNIKNALIIIDEIDAGNKLNYKLHAKLLAEGLMDVNALQERNVKLVVISATMVYEINELKGWESFHGSITMTIPAEYIGHNDFLSRGVLYEFYSLKEQTKAEQWIREDILNNYAADYRVHIVRVDDYSAISVRYACSVCGIKFVLNTSEERLTEEEKYELFINAIDTHVVVGVKGFLRRANLIPNVWKKRIGAIHELYTVVINNNAQVQGLVGRMTGYWRSVIDAGHKIGPYRTSLRAIYQYEQAYHNPFAVDAYQSLGFRIHKGKQTSSQATMLSPQHVVGLQPINQSPTTNEYTIMFRVYDNFTDVKNACGLLHYRCVKAHQDERGFYVVSLGHTNGEYRVISLQEAIAAVQDAIWSTSKRLHVRTYYPCYEDVNNKDTLQFVLIIRPGDESKMNNLPPIPKKYNRLEVVMPQ